MVIFQQNAHFANDFFNDRVESIRINGNCRWLLYEHSFFLGSVHFLAAGYYASAPRWGGSNNAISSARVIPQNTVAILLFQHGNYRGRMLTLYSSNTHLPSLDFGDHVSSIIITGGTWTVYEHSNYGGRSSRLAPGEYPSIRSFRIGEDAISSVRMG